MEQRVLVRFNDGREAAVANLEWKGTDRQLIRRLQDSMPYYPVGTAHPDETEAHRAIRFMGGGTIVESYEWHFPSGVIV